MVTFSWLGRSPLAVAIVTPFCPSVKPFWLETDRAVSKALLPAFSGMYTAPPSAAASAAFCTCVASICQRLNSSARPANAAKVTKVRATHTM